MNATTNLLRDLVRLPSVNPMTRALTGPEIYEHQVTAYLEEFFRKLGVRWERQPIAPLRENIVAHSDLPGARPTVILEAHQDTVPADNMTVAPFAAAIEGDKLYGRGACDIKGGMAAMLAAFARLVRERPAQGSNVVMACTVDEEHTFLGVSRLVRDALHADMAVVAEPTQLQIVVAHKGVVRWSIDTLGRACHSSTPEQGRNAIYAMGEVLDTTRKYADWLRASKTDPLLGPPTLSVGRIEGGSSVNTVPDRCRIEIDRRLIPGEHPSQAPADLTAYLRDALGVDFPFEASAPWLYTPALAPDLSRDLVHRLGRAIASVKGSHQVTAVPYGTDAGVIAEAGIPAVVFGPGDIACAHTRDEWVSLREVEEAGEIYFRFISSG
jgi:acetylornithine deacetylase/succinyl-diaminopimelate desuccinylase family protein